MELRAGDLSLTIDGATLRWIRWRDTEILRALEFSVRGPTWDTLAPKILDLAIGEPDLDGRLEVVLELDHRKGSIDLATTARLVLDPEGTLAFSTHSTARSTFQRNRIGIIVLHPMGASGRAVGFKDPDSRRVGRFPTEIAPAPVATDLIGLDWHPVAGVTAAISFSGELWEMEDQRNWTDASFKSYPTPLRFPHPATVNGGAIIEQRVELTVRGSPRRRVAREPVDRVVIGTGARRPPALESELPEDLPFASLPLDEFGAIGVRRLRAVIDVEALDLPQRLADLASTVRALSATCAIDLLVGQRPIPESLAMVLPQTDTIFAFDRTIGRAVDSSNASVTAVRRYLEERPAGRTIPVGGGTRGNFAELNVLRPVGQDIDVGTYSLSPQIHAFDAAAMVETLPVLPRMANQAHRLLGGRPVAAVVSLRPRFNPLDPTRSDPAISESDRYDERQGSRFAAAWMLGAMAGLSVPNVRSVCVAETHGPAGIVATDADRPRITPLAVLLAALGQLFQGRLQTTRGPADVAAMAIDDKTQRTIFIANLSERTRRISIEGAPGRLQVAQTLRDETPSQLDTLWQSRNARLNALDLNPWEVASLVVV